jgi:hypothetical protein
MLGSLVIIYPTAHEGGELVLRHKGHEWKFDANSLTVSQSSPSLAYIAFYSDIEHEVLEVTSGRRVTVTYNLYFVDPLLRPEASAVAPDFKSFSNLRTTLQGLLKSPEFLPNGGTLGFGLAHLYPVTFETKLQDMKKYLKGEDAHVYRDCRELQLQPSLRVIYDDNESGEGEYGIMLNRIIKDPDYNFEVTSYEGTLVVAWPSTKTWRIQSKIAAGSASGAIKESSSLGFLRSTSEISCKTFARVTGTRS